MVLALIAYPRVVQWLSFHFALRVRNQTQAVLWSLVTDHRFVRFFLLVVELVRAISSISPHDPAVNWILWAQPDPSPVSQDDCRSFPMAWEHC